MEKDTPEKPRRQAIHRNRGLIRSIGVAAVEAEINEKAMELLLENYVQEEAMPTADELREAFAGTDPKTGIPFTAVEISPTDGEEKPESSEVDWWLVSYGGPITNSTD